MRKLDFIVTLRDAEGLHHFDAKKMTDTVFRHIHRCLVEGKEVRIEGVGKIELKYTKPHKQINNFTGLYVKVPSKVKLKLKVFPTINNELQKLVEEDDEETHR